MEKHDEHNDEKVTPELQASADILADALMRKREHDYLEKIKTNPPPSEPRYKNRKK